MGAVARARTRTHDREPAVADDGALHLLASTLGETLTRIARESRDALGETQDPALLERIRSIGRLATEGLEDLASARDALSHERLRKRTLLPSLRALTQRFEAQTRIHTQLRAPSHSPMLRDEIARAIYAVADQALEGLERHSRATGVVLSLHADEEQVVLLIRDDGVGLLARQGNGWRASPHVAIRAMTRTIESVGGTVGISSARPRGLLVRAVVPLGNAAV